MTVGKTRRRWDDAIWRDHVGVGERKSGRPRPENGAKNCGRRIRGKWKKIRAARVKPHRVIYDALVFPPRKHSDRRSNGPGNTESTCFRGFVFLCMQRSYDESTCCPQL